MQNQKATDVLQQLADDDKLPSRAKEQLLKFASRMDSVVLLDPSTQEFQIDEQMLQKALEESIPGPFAATFLNQMRNDPNSRLTTSAKSPGLKPITWLDFAARQGMAPAPENTVNFKNSPASVAQSSPTTPVDLSASLRQILPGISDAALQPGAIEAQIRQFVSSQSPATSGPIALSSAGPNWNAIGVCCSNRIGWWVWPAIAWVLVCFIVTFPNLLLGAAIAAASVGLGTATIIVNCIIRPF